MEDFQINYTDINNLFWEYKTNLENLMNKIDYCEWCINQFIENAVFTGSTADALKSYLTDVHITMLSSLRVTAQNLLDNMTLYKAGYYDIDNSTNFKLSEEAIREFRTKSSTNYSDTESYTGKIQGAVSGISDISGVGTPSSNGVLELHEQLDQELLNFITTIQNQESSTVTALENSVDLLISSLNSCIAKVGLNQGAIASYESNSFYTDKDVYTLANISQVFYQQHEDNKDVYEAMLEVEQNLKDAVQERETQGIWKIVGVAVLIATGAACIVLTGGAATPIVADVAVAVGSGTAVFGAADAIEGTQDIYYGSTGDIDSTAVNGIKDDLFQGNEDAYYLTENAFAFAASAMIPIGQASTAGNLTFKSTATIVAKEGISMGAGAGAQKITTDVTGNDTAGMVAGMVASGVTAKGLNGIEAEANKLAKAPKGIDGVTEEAGKGLEGAAKGAESAAEDVGKVVESGSSSGKVWDYSKQFDGELANFNAGYEIKNVIKEDLYLVQFHSNAEVGSGRSLKYWTTFDAANRISTVDDYMNQMALLSNWGARDNVSIAKIPAGTKIKYAIGTAKEQVGAIESRPGGGLQILFEKFDDGWVLDTRPLP